MRLIAAAALLSALALSCAEKETSSSGSLEPPAPPIRAGAVPGRGPAPPIGCDRVAATNGSDANTGTAAAPYRSPQRVIDALSEGQTGCFRTGMFDTDATISVSRAGLTLSSYPGERATLRGLLKIEKGADGVTVSDIDIDARNSYDLGPIIFASNARFDNVDVTDHHTGICFILGASDPAAGRAVDTVIENSRIHDCGRLSATNGDHGIYVERSDGAVIRNNWIYDNADRGIQLYPDAQGTEVYGNVIDGNGQGIVISGDGGTASGGNLIRNNVISNSKIRWNVESNWPGGLVGVGNTVRDNCLWATNPDSYYHPNGGIIVPAGGGQRGFGSASNRVADPRFVDPERRDFRLRSSSSCRFPWPGRPNGSFGAFG